MIDLPWKPNPDYHRLLNALHRQGYDAFWLGPKLNWPGLHSFSTQDSATLSRGLRTWVNEKAGKITNWEEFERYPCEDPPNPGGMRIQPKLHPWKR